MTQKRVQRRSHADAKSDYNTPRARRGSDTTPRERRNSAWTELRTQDSSRSSGYTYLPGLIAQDAPLKTHSTLVLMYGPFQAEMAPENGQGVASWIRDCVRKYGLPSLVRFDYRYKAQVFRRDQFQPWLEPLMAKISS